MDPRGRRRSRRRDGLAMGGCDADAGDDDDDDDDDDGDADFLFTPRSADTLNGQPPLALCVAERLPGLAARSA